MKMNNKSPWVCFFLSKKQQKKTNTLCQHKFTETQIVDPLGVSWLFLDIITITRKMQDRVSQMNIKLVFH